MWSSKCLMYVLQGLSCNIVPPFCFRSVAELIWVCFFFPSCLMTTPCQWFKLVTGFVLVTMVAQTGVCSLWKNNIFLSCHMLTERGQCVFSLFYTFQVMQNDDTEWAVTLGFSLWRCSYFILFRHKVKIPENVTVNLIFDLQ